MRKTKGLIIGLVAAIIGLSVASCAKEDNTLQYNNVTMGNVVNGVFTSDQGNIFNVVEQTCFGKLDTMKRAFIICDVLQNTEEKENEFDIRLNYIANVLTKNAVATSEVENIETYMNDPIVLMEAWFSGGYANIYLMIPIKKSGTKPHEINLLHEKTDKGYKLSIRHDASGEVLKGDAANNDLVLAYAYASFPITSIIKEDSAIVTIEWNSYSTNGQIVSAQTKTLTVDKEYKKSSFDHVPEGASSGIATYCLE